MNIFQAAVTILLSIVVLIGFASVFCGLVNGIQSIIEKRNEQ